MRLRLVLGFALCPLTHSAPASPQSAAQIQLGRATLVGRRIDPLNQEFFGNIPFAEAPVGELRLAPPVGKFELVEEESRDAREFGASCPQSGLPISEISEDCLTINVLRPAGIGEASAESGLPVMVWVFGGGFFAGSASSFNGSAIVEHSVQRGTPVIYVNFNYRLGPLGFPQGAEARERGALNLGSKDILVALEWVQRNIRMFGGDPSKVTVFGQSAGSIALHQLLLQKDFDKLARAAIFQSGSAASAFIFPPERRSPDWNNFVSAVPECANNVGSNDTFSCLRRADLETLVDATTEAYARSSEQFPFQPAIDGSGGLLPGLPSGFWEGGEFARIPFLAGTCQDEGTVFIPPTFDSSDTLRQWIIANTSPSEVPQPMHMAIADKLLELYPDDPEDGSPFGTGNQTFGLSSQYKRASAYIGDFAFQSQRRFFMEMAVKAGVKGFGYIFTQGEFVGSQSTGTDNYIGVSHSSDLAYTYGEILDGPDQAVSLSRNMMDYWISFVTSLDPNDSHGNISRSLWDPYTFENKVLLELNGENLRMVPDNYRDEQIAFMNSVPVALRH